jgi:predicted aspartyl protease
MNGHRQRVRVDTGASGLLMSVQAAASAGLVPEAEIKTGGFGDAGAANAFVTHVDRVKIGGLEYRNCLVRVVAKSVNLDTDGLIGTDVFRDSVVTLDFPGNELRLTPLPPLPEGVAQEVPGEPLEEGAEAGAPSARKDRYIAPEMKDWTEVFRIGPQLMFPTRIGDAPRKLFLLDSGSTQGIISPEAAREVTQVTTPDPDKAHLHGISGAVNAVYQAQNLVIEFGGVR